MRLKWGSGIASRGRYTGADRPLDEAVPERPKGRKRDLSRERRRLAAEFEQRSPGLSRESLIDAVRDANMDPGTEVQFDDTQLPTMQDDALFQQCTWSIVISVFAVVDTFSSNIRYQRPALDHYGG